MLNYEKFFEAKNHKGHLLTDQSAMQDLFQRLHFGEAGGIWFNGERSLLLDIHEFSGLLGEIIGRYGLAESRAIFTRIGYQKGYATLCCQERYEQVPPTRT